MGKLIGLLLFCLLLLLLSINVHTKKIQGMSSLIAMGTIFLVDNACMSCGLVV